jgi:hypothetical protein
MYFYFLPRNAQLSNRPKKSQMFKREASCYGLRRARVNPCFKNPWTVAKLALRTHPVFSALRFDFRLVLQFPKLSRDDPNAVAAPVKLHFNNVPTHCGFVKFPQIMETLKGNLCKILLNFLVINDGRKNGV